MADDGARVGERVHRMSHAVDQACAVAGLLAHNAAQVVGHLALVGPVVHVALDVEAHLAHLAVGAAVLGALERADGAGVGRVGVGAAGGEHAAGERGVVAAAVLCLQHEHDVEHVCLVVGVCVVGTQGVQNGLGGGETGTRAVPHHVAAVVALLDGVVRKHGDARHARDEAERGVHLVLEPGVVGRGVGGVEMKHAAAQHVHHVFGGAREDVVVHEAAGQVALVVEQARERGEVLPGGQVAREQQVHKLLVAEAALACGALDQVVDAVTTKRQATLAGFLVAFVHHVAVNVGDLGDAGDHARAVGVAQAALDVGALELMRVDAVRFRKTLVNVAGFRHLVRLLRVDCGACGGLLHRGCLS